MILQHEHGEDISCVYLLNQIFEFLSDLFAKQISTRILRFSACALAIFTEYTAWAAFGGISWK